MASASIAALELLPLEGATSSVWTHFGFPSSNGQIIEEWKNRKQVYCMQTLPQRTEVFREHNKPEIPSLKRT